MSINAAKWTFIIFCFVCAFFMTSFHSFSIVAFCIWNQHGLGMKDLLSVSRGKDKYFHEESSIDLIDC